MYKYHKRSLFLSLHLFEIQLVNFFVNIVNLVVNHKNCEKLLRKYIFQYCKERPKLNVKCLKICLKSNPVHSDSDILAGPICALINSSIRQGYVPSQWKLARVTPIPKINPPKHLESDFYYVFCV